MSGGSAGGILFLCTGPAEWEPDERGWSGEIKITRRSVSMVEFIIYGRSSCMNGIVGKYMSGQYVCIPDINVGCPLSRFSDILWNKEAKCAGNADNLKQKEQNRPPGKSQAAFLHELSIIPVQFCARI